jgi:hypothetical protein
MHPYANMVKNEIKMDLAGVTSIYDISDHSGSKIEAKAIHSKG